MAERPIQPKNSCEAAEVDEQPVLNYIPGLPLWVAAGTTAAPGATAAAAAHAVAELAA